MSIPDFSGPVDGPAEVPSTGDDQPGARDRAELEQEVQRLRLELAAVERDFDSRLREQISRCDATIEAVRERDGRARGESLASIREDISNLEGLLAEHDQQAGRAGAQLPGNDAADWIGHYRGAVEEKVGDLRRLESQLRREQHIEESHISRVPGLAERDLSGISRTIVTQVARTAAMVLASHIGPGIGDHLVRGCEMIMRACDAPGELDRGEALKLEVPLSVGGALIGLNIGTMLSDDDAAAGEPPPPAGCHAIPSSQPPSWPSVEIVEEGVSYQHAGQAPEIAQLTPWRWWAPDAPSQEGQGQTEAPAAAGQEPGGQAAAADSSRPDTPPAAGVVIWGSAKVIAAAARMRILSSDVLLSFARREAFRKIYDGTPGSVMAAMDAACGIEVVVLLDPDIQGGLWVDVDPVTQAPAATMLIEMPVSADGRVADLRLLRYEA